jgi:hypothetical protein
MAPGHASAMRDAINVGILAVWFTDFTVTVKAVIVYPWSSH